MTDDLNKLRHNYPAPRAITLSLQHHGHLRSKVDRSIYRHERRDNAVRAIAAPATVLACAAAVAIASVLAVSGSPPVAAPQEARAVMTSAAATRVLYGAADRALASPAFTVREDQFVYTRSAAITNEGDVGDGASLGPLHEREVWFSQDPGAFGWREDVIREFGQDWPLDLAGPQPAGAGRPTYAWLEQLPTDPDELLDELGRTAIPVEGQEQAQATFEMIGSLVSEQLVPPETAAALFLAVTRIDGVEVDKVVTDALGRHGVGITRVDTRFHTRSTWIFDPVTYELRGTRWFFTHDDGSPDTLFGATAVLETDVVDHAGQRPGSGA